MKPERTEPIPMKAGDKRVMVNGEPVQVDFRIISEELYQELSQSSPVESKWVSVDECYPEYMDVVLIHATLGFVTMAQYGGGNTFSIGDESYIATHWQHLPPSPELPIEEPKEK